MVEQRILIVGGGIAGVATAYFLARSGHRSVTLIEMERQPGVHSTGLNAGILRTWTGDDVNRALGERSAEFLRQPPAGFSDVPLVDPVGLVLVSDPRRSFSDASWEQLRSSRSDLEELSPEGLAAIAPHFAPRAAGEGTQAFFLRDEGILDTAAMVEGFEHGALRAGVAFRFGERVSELVLASGSVCGVRLANGEVLHADQVVLAAGGWAGRLGAAVGSKVELRPTRRHLLVTEVDTRVDPRWPVVWTDVDPFYARPESGGLLISACDQVDVDPDALGSDPTVKELVAEKAARYLPALGDAGVAHFWAGVRTLTPDDRFVVGPDADVEGLFWVAGLGGHGMTASAAVGELAAGLLLDPGYEHAAASAVAPARFVPLNS